MRCNLTRLLVGLGLVWLSATATAASEGEPLDAIWRSQTLAFSYQAERTLYTCQGLATRVAQILRALGARGQGSMQLSCAAGTGSRLLLQITLSTPIEATPENVLAATTTDATERLLAHLQDRALPSENDIERFPAQWRTIALTGTRGLGLGAGDCELIHGIKEQILPKLAVRLTAFRCQTDSAIIQPRVTVQALMPLARR